MSEKPPVRFIHPWRDFRRMQYGAAAVALLAWAAAGAHGWRVLPGGVDLKRAVLIGFPLFFALLTCWIAVGVGPVRRRLKRYVWMSFVAGYGQTAASVVSGLAVLAFACVFLFAEIARGAAGGRWPAGAFSAMGAGVGVLLAQAVLTWLLQREPQARETIVA